MVVPRLLWLHAIPCLPYYTLLLPPPLLSFWLQTTNSCLALLQISIEDRSKTITKTWTSTIAETKTSAKSDNQQLLFQKWSWKEKCPPVAKHCSTLSTSTKFRKFAIALALSSNVHFKNIFCFLDNAARWCSPALQTRQGRVNSNAPHYEYSPLGVISCAWQGDLWNF